MIGYATQTGKEKVEDMYKKIRIWSRRFIPVLTLSLLCQNFGFMQNAETVKAAENKISLSAEHIKAKNANGHEAALIADGDRETYWQSIPSNGEGDNLKRMYDHNHYIDITLDGTYQLSQIKIFNRVNGSFNNYYVYASADGENYDKIISKTSNDPATAEGDSYTLGDVSASYLRLNMAYNSDAFATNLSEIELYGTKISDTVPEPDGIQVEDWQGSSWQIEWDKFKSSQESDRVYADQKVLKEMSSMVGRVLGEQWRKSFRFEMRNSLEDGKDVFEIKDGADSTIVIRGNSGLAMASGFNYYLKNYVNVDYNPLFGSNVNLDELKPVGNKVVREAQFANRYALNFCTYSYTMSFWNWDEYEEFLDWCAMNGINLVLDIVGQEEVLRQTLKEFHYTDEEIKDYICGPAYFAWFYMQNLYSVGGPLPDAWFEQRTELGRRIHDRMQTYGISPVIQGFAGQVPETFAEKNEGAVLIATGNWSGFTRPTMIKTYLTDADKANNKVNYFPDVAETFYEKQKNVFGDVSHYYATDPFHEGGNTGGLDTAAIFSEAQKEMLKSDKDAIWVMQQWQGNLDATKMSQLDKSKTLPLVLHADMKPGEKDDFERWETPWVYCMLHDFGGRMGLDGEVPVIAVDPIDTFHNTNYMAGIGITAEALENSPVVYELMFDTNWSKDPIDYYAWLKKYGERRAGGESKSLWKAWKILLKTAYADKGITYQGAAETVINARPADSFTAASSWGHSTILYDKAEVDQALLLLAENYEAFQASPAFQYDLADVAEQVLCNAAVEYHRLMVQAKNERNLKEFEKLSTDFLELIELSDEILSTTDEFMLGTWVEASRKMITDADDWTKDLFEFNARALVTTWAGERPCGSGGLKDYSNRKWAGLTDSFYKERWAIWIRNRIADLKGEQRNAADAKAESNWFLWEYQWVNRKSDDADGAYAFETEPSGADLAQLAERAYEEFSYTNLEKNTGGTAQEIENIAKDKTVTTVSTTKTGSLSNITDGDTGTAWIAEGAGPHTLEIDLEQTYHLSKMILSGPQRAGTIPYKWKAEYYNSSTAAWVLLKEQTKFEMTSNTEIEVPAGCTASKVRVTMTTSDAQSYPLEITEITVNGKEGEGEAYENLAQSMTVRASVGDGSDAQGELAKLTDGNTSSVWSAQNWQNGGSNFPVTVTMELPESTYTDTLEVYFESAGRPFTFYAAVTDETGQEIKVSPAECETQDVTENSYRMDVKKKISQVKICITGNTGSGQFPGSWPALAEIKVMGTPLSSPDEPVVDFTGKQVSGITVSGGGATDKVIDGNKETFDRVTENQNIVFDLHGTYYLSHVNFTFEKGELGLRYKVLAQDASGGESTICDASQSTSLLGNRTVRVPVGKEVKKITLIHMGNNGQGPASAAEKRLYEFEAFGVGKPDSGSVTASPAASAGLLDGSAEYTAAAGTSVTLTLSKAEDVNMVRIVRGEQETKALKYKAEYYDEEKQSWNVFADLSENENAAGESFAVADGIVFTKQIRLTWTEGVTLSGITLYTTDYAGILANRVGQIRTVLNGADYGENKGQYKLSAKEVAEAVLTEAEAAAGITSQTIDAWLEKVNDALETFYETGVVYLDRSAILAAMADAKELLDKQDAYEIVDKRSELMQAYEAARQVYETYHLSQSQLNNAASALGEMYDAVLELIGDAIDKKDAEEAKKELDQFVADLEEKHKGDYTSESWNAYEEALKAAAAVQANPNATKEEILSVKFRLEQAILSLKKADGNPEMVERITLTAAKTSLTVGETIQIKAVVQPDHADVTLKWNSQNPSVASVNAAGVVSAKAEGTAVITAAAQDGSGVTGTITFKITKPPVKLPPVGKVYKTSTLEYKITASSETKKTVIVQKSLQKKSKKIVIPATVKIDNIDYQVTEIKAKVFRSHTKATQLTIGANVKKIGGQAFYGCKKLKKITVSSKTIQSIGKKAFANIDKKVKITVPKAKQKDYKKMFQKAKAPKTAKFIKK